MDDMAKLKSLIEHWIEHNQEHVRNYAEWADKALKAGKPELSDSLREVAAETKRMERLFLKARKVFD